MAKVFRYVYLGAAWLFLVGVVCQVYLAGMTVVARKINWDNHIGLGHIIGGPLILMLLSAYLGQLSGSMKRLTWVLFGVYVLQADVLIFLRVQVPLLSAFHPVLALVDFALGLTLARRAWPLARQELARAGAPANLKTPAES
jgi:hypothetical protein